MVSDSSSRKLGSDLAIPPKPALDPKRERMLRALAVAFARGGGARVTVAQVIREAGMARSSFYELFENIDDALEQGVALACRRLRAKIEATPGADFSWSESTAAMIARLLDEISSEPELANLCLCRAGSSYKTRSAEPDLLDALVAVIGRGREESSERMLLPQTEMFLASGVLSVIAERVRKGDAAGLPSLAGELTALLTMPVEDHQHSDPPWMSEMGVIVRRRASGSKLAPIGPDGSGILDA